MSPTEIQHALEGWLREYRGLIVYKLRLCRVPPQDHADVLQDVLIVTWAVLARGESIHNPRAWLMECIWKQGSTYRRKELGRESFRPEIARVESEERAMEAREELRFVLGHLDVQLHAIVLEARCDNLSWEEIARSRNVKSDHARYLYKVAVGRMEEARRKEASHQEKPKIKKSRLAVLPLLLTRGFDSLRASLKRAASALAERGRDGVDRFMESLPAGAEAPESVGSPAPVSRRVSRLTAPAPKIGQLLWGLGVFAFGIPVGCFLRSSPPDKPAPEPERAHMLSLPALAAAEPEPEPAPARDAESVSLLPSTPQPSGSRASPLAQSVQAGKRSVGTSALEINPPLSSHALLERARAALKARDTRAALALLAQHARGFSGKLDTAARLHIRQLVCAEPAARGAPECLSLRSRSAREQPQPRHRVESRLPQ